MYAKVAYRNVHLKVCFFNKINKSHSRSTYITSKMATFKRPSKDLSMFKKPMEYGVILDNYTNSEQAYYEELAVRDSTTIHVYGQDYIITTIDATITNRDTEPSCMK